MKENLTKFNEHPIIIEDFNEIISDKVIPWPQFENSTILITGATGLIGSLTAKLLLYASLYFNMNIKIYAIVRNIEKAKNIFKGQKKFWGENIIFYEADVRQPLPYDLKADYILHTASITSSIDFINNPVDVIRTTLDGTKNILELSLKNNSRSIVYISSMEIYGLLNHELAHESDSGFIDPLAIRSSYPQSKRMAETLCAAYAAQYDLPVKIARPTLTFGAGVFDSDNRVYAQFARSVLTGSNIVLHTKGNTKRDYIYTSDAVRSILSILLLGENGKAYNISNPATYSTIYEMAQIVASLGEKSQVVFDCNDTIQKRYAPEIQIQLDCQEFNKLNKFPHKKLREMFVRMMAFMKDNLY